MTFKRHELLTTVAWTLATLLAIALAVHAQGQNGFQVKTIDGTVVAECSLRGFSQQGTPDIDDCQLRNGANITQLIQTLSAAIIAERERGDNLGKLAEKGVGLAHEQEKLTLTCLKEYKKFLDAASKYVNAMQPKERK